MWPKVHGHRVDLAPLVFLLSWDLLVVGIVVFLYNSSGALGETDLLFAKLGRSRGIAAV